jgi:hypothetical protein
MKTLFEITTFLGKFFVPAVFRVVFFAQSTELFFEKGDFFFLSFHESLSEIFIFLAELVVHMVRSTVVTRFSNNVSLLGNNFPELANLVVLIMKALL